MRYGIFADIHSNLEAFKAVLKVLNREKVDKYLCAGDVVGYGANPQECIDKIKEENITTVAGNHDWGAVELFSKNYFNPAAYEAILWTKNNLDEVARLFLGSLQLVLQSEDLTLVHGTLVKPEEFDYLLDIDAASETFELLETKLCFVGHSHAPGVFVKENGNILYLEENSLEIKNGNKYIINVGSVGQPRDGDPRAAYCVYDKEEKTAVIKRVEYDVKTASKKIIKSGLPKYLGERLLLGM
jgi:predicted phosphodiesterase